MYRINKFKCVAVCLVSVCLIGIVLCGCMSGHNSTEEGTQLPKLIIGCDDFEPYIFRDENGGYAGFDVEIAYEACRRMGYTPVFKSVIWDDVDKYLENGEIDCAWAGFSMNGIEDCYTWVGPYMCCDEVIMVRADSDIYTLQDLEGKNIAVQSATHSERLFLKNEIVDVKNVYCFSEKKEIFAALRKGYTDACAGHDSAIKEYLNQYGTEYRILDKSISISRLGIAFSKSKDTTKADLLAETIKDMLEDGTIKNILEKYGLSEQAVCGGND